MKIGIITAMPAEFRAVSEGLGDVEVTLEAGFRVGRFSFTDDDILLVESGIGIDNASRATEKLVKLSSPDLLISAGFCGGIVPGLAAGDIVVAKTIVIVDKGGYEEIPVLFSSIGQNFVARYVVEEGMGATGTFVTTSAITSKACLAKMLSGRYHKPVVEMESGAVAIIAAENNIPLLAIRAVSDSASEELEFSLEEFCDSGMKRIVPYKVLMTVLRKPYIIPQLLRLSRSSRNASHSLKSAFSLLFPRF